VLARDRRCRVTGCIHATFVDVHHLQPRSEGGRNEASKLLVSCSAHHRAVHCGELLVGRDPDGSPSFWHADGSPYGAPATPQHIDALAKVFSALRHLGFREVEVKAVLGPLRADTALNRRARGAPAARSAAPNQTTRAVRGGERRHEHGLDPLEKCTSVW
jgi:hypothetical protein